MTHVSAPFESWKLPFQPEPFNILHVSKEKWCFSKSGNNRFTPVIYPAGYPQPENFSTVVFNSQGPDHRYNPLTILLNSWILPVSANCQQNKSGTVHRLLIIEEQEVEKSWFGRRLLKARLAILLYPVVCHSCWRVSSGKIAGVVRIRRWKTEELNFFMVIPAVFQRRMEVKASGSLQERGN